MSVEYLDLADFIAISAAAFGDREFYEDFIDKAAALVVRLARNHAWPDGKATIQRDDEH